MNPPHIDFNRAAPMGREMDYLAEAVRSARISGNGPFTRRCEDLLRTQLGVASVLLTSSGTHALDMTALLLDIKPGDEVIIPSFTFVSTVNAFVLRGARPIFCDIRPDTLNLDERALPRLVSPRTRAIVPVHYAGVACEMDGILDLASRHGIAVIEDNAHGLYGRYRGRWLGTFGRMAAVSFHETKNITCGEGGALILNDARDLARAEIIREKGTDRTRFFRGEVDKYSWVDCGSSYVLSDMLAAFLWGQLECRDQILAARRRIWDGYAARLGAWAVAHGVVLPAVPAHCEHPYHCFYLILPTPDTRDGLLKHLRARGIHAVFHYLPLHLSTMGRAFGGVEGACPVTEDISARLLRLPFYNVLTDSDHSYVCDAVQRFSP